LQSKTSTCMRIIFPFRYFVFVTVQEKTKVLLLHPEP
jgi:hypothetical protein